MSKQQDWKTQLGNLIVPLDESSESEHEVEANSTHLQKLTVYKDNKRRKGKTVTIIEGFEGADEELEMLSKMIKMKCGVGGTAKDGEIVMQGDLKTKIKEILEKEGHKVKIK